MPETPSPSPASVTRKRQPGHALFNQAQTLELNKAKKICVAALSPKYRAALEARGITESFVAGLGHQIDRCRQRSSEAMQQTLLKENYTAEERLAKRALLKAITEIQSAAKQKYTRSNRARLQDFCVGKDIDASRAALEQHSQHILERLGGEPNSPHRSSAPADSFLPADTLPGIKPEKVAALSALRAKWMEAQSNQAQSQALATSLRAERDALVQSITDQRIQIQFAAEAEWPACESASAEKRQAFLLQPSRPFSLAA